MNPRRGRHAFEITRSGNTELFARSFPDFRAFMSRPSCGHLQTIVRSFPDHRPFMSRLSCVHQTEKITCWGVVQILEAEDRERPKTPKMQIFKVFFLREVHEHLYSNSRHCFFCYGEQNSWCLSISIKNKMNL